MAKYRQGTRLVQVRDTGITVSLCCCRGLDNWRSKLYANYHPSYYGMMVASFLRETAGQWNMDM